MDIERLQNEPQKAFALFMEYINLGKDRSLAKLSQTSKKSISTLKSLSVKFLWVDRARAWDQMIAEALIEQDKETHIQMLKDFRNRRVALSKSLTSATNIFLCKLLDRISRFEEIDFESLTPMQASIVFKHLANATPIVFNEEFASLGIQELMTYLDLANK